MTLLQMRDAAKDLSDYQNNPAVSDATWTRWLNDGIERLWRIVSKVDAGLFQTSFLFTLTGSSNLQAKPAQLRRLLGVSRDPLVIGQRRSLPKYNFGQRDSLGAMGPLSYHVIGANVAIEPGNVAAGNYALYYVSGPTILAADTDVIDAALEPYDDYATTWAATKALGKEESDTRDLYGDLAYLEQTITESIAMSDGDDPATIVDDDERGPSGYFSGGAVASQSASGGGDGAISAVPDVASLKNLPDALFISNQTIVRVISPSNRLYFLQENVPPQVDDSGTTANFVISNVDGRLWVGA